MAIDGSTARAGDLSAKGTGRRARDVALDAAPQAGLRVLAALLALDAIVVAGAVSAGVMLHLRPDALFAEGEIVTAYSALQLIAIAAVSMRIFQLRRNDAARAHRALSGATSAGAFETPSSASSKASRAAVWMWAIGAAAFLWLAMDELFAIHEWLDGRIHAAFHLRETPWTDRIDDAIMLAYGLAGVAVLWCCRSELRLFRNAARLLRWAAALFFIMVALDMITNSYNIDLAQRADRTRLEWLAALGNIGEETFKLAGESVFLAAFLAAASVGNRRG